MSRAPEALRADVLACLKGFSGGGAAECAARDMRRTESGIAETLVLHGASRLPATLVRPDGPGPFPAVLYCHAHGGDFRLGRRELTEGRTHLQSPPYGTALPAMGFAALCIDMPGFGERRGEGTEAALAKAHLWHGGSLFAAMLTDLSDALGYLSARPDIDARRLYAFGLSMGAAHAYWLAALDARVAGLAHLCMMADIGPLVATGAHDAHGPYLTVPGLLAIAETGDIAGLAAPRPQLVCHGGDDPLAPAPAREAATRRLMEAYRAAEAEDALTVYLAPDAGHVETAEMRVAVLDFLARAADRDHRDFERLTP